jgi:hypothetical protein
MTKKSRPRKRKKAQVVQQRPARCTLILEDFAGIKKQTWVGTPQELSVNWPIDVMNLLGERSEFLITPVGQVEIKVTLPYQGMSYRADHTK